MTDRDSGERVLGYGDQAVASADAALEDRVTSMDARDDGTGGGGGGGTATKAPPAPPKDVPGPWPGASSLSLSPATKGSEIESYVNDAIGKTFPNIRLALIDLTDLSKILYVGHRDDDYVPVHSVAKLCILHAAFALRTAARAALPKIMAVVKDDPLGTLDLAWKPALQGAMLPDDAVRDERPLLKAIFAPVTGDGSTVSFATAPTDADAKAGIASFADRLFASIRSSSNDASAKLIRDIGFPYMNMANDKAGLRQNGKGLRLTLDFAGRARSKSGAGAQAGTARRLAEFMALLQLDRLVSGTSSEMIDLLGGYDGEGLKGLGSVIAQGVFGLVPDARAATFFCRAKVGYLKNRSDYCEAALVRRPHNGKNLVYAAALLQAKDEGQARIVGGLLDEAIRQRWP